MKSQKQTKIILNICGNHTYLIKVADSLANFGCTLSSPICWFHAPDFLSVGLEKNKLGFPSFRVG
jgi:hypothetical protein